MQQFCATKRNMGVCSLAATDVSAPITVYTESAHSRLLLFCIFKRPVAVQPPIFNPSLSHMLDRLPTDFSVLPDDFMQCK